MTGRLATMPSSENAVTITVNEDVTDKAAKPESASVRPLALLPLVPTRREMLLLLLRRPDEDVDEAFSCLLGRVDPNPAVVFGLV